MIKFLQNEFEKLTLENSAIKRESSLKIQTIQSAADTQSKTLNQQINDITIAYEKKIASLESNFQAWIFIFFELKQKTVTAAEVDLNELRQENKKIEDDSALMQNKYQHQVDELERLLSIEKNRFHPVDELQQAKLVATVQQLQKLSTHQLHMLQCAQLELERERMAREDAISRKDLFHRKVFVLKAENDSLRKLVHK